MKRSKAVVAGGAILAILGMLLAFVYTQGATKKLNTVTQSNSAGEARAWVALEDLTLGSTWGDISDLVSEQSVPANVRPVEAIANPSDIAEKTLVRNVMKGEVLTSVQFNATGAESLSIPEGTSALTLSFPHPQGVGDYIQPGAKADIFVTVKPDGNPLTKLLLSNIPVLSNRRALSAEALANGAQAPAGEADVLLTFAVTTDQAERIIFAKENGSLWLTLTRPGSPDSSGNGQTYGSFLE